MIAIRQHLDRLRRDERGVAAIELAIVAPVLLMLSLGTFQVSAIVARQAELQSAMAEAEAVALASAPTTDEKRATLRSIIVQSTGLDENSVTVALRVRCGAQTTLQATNEGCTTQWTNYAKIDLADSYTPIWTHYGFGHTLQFRVTRYVLLNQKSL